MFLQRKHKSLRSITVLSFSAFRFGIRVVIPPGSHQCIRSFSANLIKRFAKYLCITLSFLSQQYALLSFFQQFSKSAMMSVQLPLFLRCWAPSSLKIFLFYFFVVELASSLCLNSSYEFIYRSYLFLLWLVISSH